MIVALEGPDLCGKTSVFQHLIVPGAAMCPGLPMDSELMPHMAAVERRQEAVWRALYDPARLYICDRHFVVTSLVYSKLYGRPVPDYSRWIPELRVLYFDAPLSVLLDRHAERGDRIAQPEHFGRVLELYDEVLRGFECVARLDATLSVHELTLQVMQRIGGWRSV